MNIRFDDHSSFHRAALGMTASSAILGAALQRFTPQAALIGGIFGIAVGAAYAYKKPALRIIAAALACLPLVLFAPSWTAFAACAGVLSLGTMIASRGIKGAFSVVLGSTITVIAMWTALRFDHARATAHWPMWVTDGVASAAMGIVGVVAMLPRHLGLAADPVGAAMKLLPASLDTEVRVLCQRSVAIWNQIDSHDDAGKDLVRDAVLKTLEVAAKSGEAQQLGTDDELARRIAEIDTRIAAATDDEVRTQYEAARSGLIDQKKYRERIRQNRERLVARLHNHLAALEKFQLAMGHAAQQQLADLSRDVAQSGSALEVGEA